MYLLLAQPVCVIVIMYGTIIYSATVILIPNGNCATVLVSTFALSVLHCVLRHNIVHMYVCMDVCTVCMYCMYVLYVHIHVMYICSYC